MSNSSKSQGGKQPIDLIPTDNVVMALDGKSVR